MLKLFLIFISCFALLQARESDLLTDLAIVDSINCKLNDKMPVYFNHLLQGGYFNMPSARMGCSGEIGAGYTYMYPYRSYNLRLQYFDRLELSGSYRIFGGVADPLLTKTGFGDFSDKGVNFKISLLEAEETNYLLPGIAFGMEDFLGTKAFQSIYGVATKVFPQYNFECSLGYGSMRIDGFFGGVAWMPFRHSCTSILRPLQFAAEYDATPYKDKRKEPHPKARKSNSHFNFGVKTRLFGILDLMASYNKGRQIAASCSVNYNLGASCGLLPKICNPPYYHSPVNTEPLGCNRDEETMVQDFFFALRCQGFDLMKSSLCGNRLTMTLSNHKWRYEWDVRTRLNDLLAYLTPSNIDYVTVVIDGPGFPVQRYDFIMDFVRGYGKGRVCPYELKVLTPLKEACPSPKAGTSLFSQYRLPFNLCAWPKFITFFGSARGKFKYAYGAYAAIDGFLFNNYWYSCQFSYTFGSNLYDVKDVDKLNPSQLINVRTDLVNYLKHDGFTLDELYLQRNFNLGCGYYFRLGGGLFELMYGGVVGEALYCPINCNFAFGIEGAWLKKRTTEGMGFTDKIRLLHGYRPSYVPFHGAQYFATLYYNLKSLDLDLAVKGGKFLANDYGARFEVCRYYPSGMRIWFWYTVTNGGDRVNGHTYFDKGIGITIPMDLFSKCSSRATWSYGMGAWLRDVGQSAYTGPELYHMIQLERQHLLKCF